MQLCEITVKYNSLATAATRQKISSSRDAADLLRKNWDDDMALVESFLILHLNTANIVRGFYRVSKGGVSGTYADARIIFGTALKTFSSAIILAHNHPSGVTTPSQPDIILTKRMVEAGKLLEIPVLDHVILSPENEEYYSFADNGMLG